MLNRTCLCTHIRMHTVHENMQYMHTYMYIYIDKHMYDFQELHARDMYAYIHACICKYRSLHSERLTHSLTHIDSGCSGCSVAKCKPHKPQGHQSLTYQNPSHRNRKNLNLRPKHPKTLNCTLISFHPKFRNP